MRQRLLGLVVLAVVTAASCSEGASTSAPEPASAAASIESSAPGASAAPGTFEAWASASSSALPAAVDITRAGATRIPMDGDPDWVSLAGGSAWIATASGVRQVDQRTGAVGATVSTGSICLAMDVGFESLWVGDCDNHALIRIDPETATLRSTIVLPVRGIQEESSVAAGEGAVWVVSTNNTLLKVDPASESVVATWPLPLGATAVRAGLGSVWIAMSSLDQLLQLGPADGTVIATIDVGAVPRFLAIGEGGVWVMDQMSGEVTHVDAGGNVVATIRVSETSIQGGDIAVGGGFVWARVGDTLIAKIDPATDTVVARYGPASGSGSVAADDSAVWVSAHDISSLWRLPLD